MMGIRTSTLKHTKRCVFFCMGSKISNGFFSGLWRDQGDLWGTAIAPWKEQPGLAAKQGDPVSSMDGSWRQENHIRQILWLLCHALFCKQSRLGSNPGVKDRVKDVIYIYIYISVSYVISLPQMGKLWILVIFRIIMIYCMIFLSLWYSFCGYIHVRHHSSLSHEQCKRRRLPQTMLQTSHEGVGRFFSRQGQETLLWKFLRGELAWVILT